MTIHLRLDLQLESPLHIGGETRQNTTAALPMLKQADGYPYVPATSIKGRLRHEVEMLLRQQGYWVCQSPAPQRMCQGDDDQCCPACWLFGSPWWESRLYFEDLKLDTSDIEHNHANDSHAPATGSRTSVSINRKRRIQANQRLFDIELFEPGYPWRFSGTATYHGNALADLFPLFLAARAVSMLGKGRSRGLGWCTLDLSVTGAAQPDLNTLLAAWQATAERWQHG